ncbi:hypothetical protein OF83DRAFT_1149633 [Amylostereum chailletii]|nr:hypothetical protein OF83DRAFT_1149633 [Amylostereum chailletii]
MDPLSIVTSVISTAIAIRDWIDALKAKEKALHELNITVSRIAQILSPLQTPSSTPSPAPSIVDVDPPPYTTSAVATVWMADVSVTSCLQDMADILGHIHEHLEIWNGKRSKYSSLLAFINPSSLLQKFRDDEKLLTQRMNVLSFALQFAAARAPHISITTPPLPSHRPSPLDTVGSSEVKRFWTDKFGTEVSCVSEESFFGALCDWLKLPLDKHTRDVMLLRLDESGVGGVTVRSLDDWVGKQNIRERVSFLDVLQGSTVMHPLSPRPQETGDDTTVRPLILWIDDNPNSVTRLCEHARSQGVTVVAITSTAAAKVWIESNQGEDRHKL